MAMIVNLLRKFWRAMPLAFRHKQYLRHYFLRMFPWRKQQSDQELSRLRVDRKPYPALSEKDLDDLLPEPFGPVDQRRLLLVAHDAHPHGAEYLVLHLAKYLHEALGFAVEMLVLGDGLLLDEYTRFANVHDLSGVSYRGGRMNRVLSDLYHRGFRHVIANTIISGQLAPVLKEQGFLVTVLIHELPGVIRQLGLQGQAGKISAAADHLVFPAEEVKAGFLGLSGCPKEKISVRAQGLFRRNEFRSPEAKARARKELANRFSLADDARIVLAVGHADLRKGIDLFVEAGIQLVELNPNAVLIWVGHFDPTVEKSVRDIVRVSGVSDHFIFPGMDFDTDVYYAASDLFTLTSREDPFPSVVLEAMDAGLPVVGFCGAGGVSFLIEQAGCLVRPGDTDALAHAWNDLLSDMERSARLGNRGARLIEREYSFDEYVLDLLRLWDANKH